MFQMNFCPSCGCTIEAPPTLLVGDTLTLTCACGMIALTAGTLADIDRAAGRRHRLLFRNSFTNKWHTKRALGRQLAAYEA